MTQVQRRWLLRTLGLLLLVGLLAWALHKAPLADIAAAIRNLHPWQLLVIVVINVLLYLLITFRWWIIVRAEARRVGYLSLLGVRLSAFGLSYFTLGPQVGGEPLQVLSLQKKYTIAYTRATASVLLDKLLEFQVNFILLALGLAALVRSGLLAQGRLLYTLESVLVALLILAPIAGLFFIYRRRYPLTWLLRHLPFLPPRSKFDRFLSAAEWMAGRFCQRHPRALLAALAASLLAGAGMLVDYTLMISFLGIRLPFWQMVTGWTAGWLAFLFPLPGGLGALESSQVFALGLLGIPAALAFSLALLMRARDLFFGGLGLLLAGRGFSAPRKKWSFT